MIFLKLNSLIICFINTIVILKIKISMKIKVIRIDIRLKIYFKYVLNYCNFKCTEYLRTFVLLNKYYYGNNSK